MPQYSYTAKTKNAKTVKDVEFASSREEIVAKLRARDLFIISLAELEGKEGGAHSFFKSSSARRKHSSVKLHDLTVLARNLAITLSSGITLLRSLEVLSGQTTSLKLEQILEDCRESVKAGLSFSDAVAKHPKVFNTLWRSIIETGEASGNLPFGLEKLADYLDMRMEFERKVKSAMVYPAILLFAGFAAIFIFFKFILPKFVDIFTQFNMDLPAPTKVIFAVSNIFGRWWWALFLLAGGLYGLYRYFRDDPEFKKSWDRVILKVPLLGNLTMLAALERFTSTLYILLDSGLPLVYTLEVSARSIGNVVLEKQLAAVKDRVRDGGSFSAEIKKMEMFPLLISEMAKIGEETGSMPEIFSKVAKYYQREVEVRVERLVTVFEPVMILFLGVIIGGMVISLFLPLFKLSSIGGGM